MIDIQKLIAEDPFFAFYAQAVMFELTQMDQQEWVYQLWVAYQQQMPPSEFVNELMEGQE